MNFCTTRNYEEPTTETMTFIRKTQQHCEVYKEQKIHSIVILQNSAKKMNAMRKRIKITAHSFFYCVYIFNS
jgi:hypothetical protein